MTKTKTRSRIVSILLVLIMLLSLMPSLELHAHAFWDDYDTGGESTCLTGRTPTICWKPSSKAWHGP